MKQEIAEEKTAECDNDGSADSPEKNALASGEQSSSCRAEEDAKTGYEPSQGPKHDSKPAAESRIEGSRIQSGKPHVLRQKGWA